MKRLWVVLGLLCLAVPKGQANGDGSFEGAAAGLSKDVRDALAAAKANRPQGAPQGISKADALAALNPAKIGIAAKFIAVGPGSFLMGSPNNEAGRFDDETQHAVTLSKGFEMQATAVTQLQYALVMGANPSSFKTKEACGDKEHKLVLGVELCVNNPVEMVSWDDAQQFIKRLNQIQDKYTYRLPSEAEREYAARGGTLSSYSFGADASGLDAHAWFYDNSNGRTHAVASKQPNPLGLYDMHGNVWEWVQDKYASYKDTPTDGSAHEKTGSSRVFRGGSWGNVARGLRSAQRRYGGPGRRSDDLGFRLVRSSR